ncbi:hypothetical protein ABB29_10620 [Pseudoxanthomonas dokdonensis]|uniref:Carboxyltransferase domain-containing protein n=2 Tax=Pseudoxanthomonas dokdonensis TaxID=344882 RepID=A0A0R0CTY2_9GAMM|nr:hypothetical protein ABB29_10620 [Pseudoxanthomonas dokdonensis]
MSSLQDRGRHAYRHLGIARSGALDWDAAWLANRLLNNARDACVLEITLQGPRLRLPAAAWIAVTGAPIQLCWRDITLPMNRPILVPAGELSLRGVGQGLRSYLAVRGGFQATTTMGSRSTDLRAGFGGIDGRTLRAGDQLPVGPQPAFRGRLPAPTRWWIGDDVDYSLHAKQIRYVPAGDPAPTLHGQRWRSSQRGNRQGLQLDGEPLPGAGASQLSEPVAPGTIQLPPDGLPIVLLADAQTVGGYQRLGHVITADLPLLAQAAPGTELVFQPVTLAEAYDAACLIRQRMVRLDLAIQSRQGPRNTS